MPDALPRSQISGTFAISNTQPGTAAVRIPAAALTPAQVSVKNGDPAAILYCKWTSLSRTNMALSSGDAGVRLEPLESYTWDSPPADALLLILSTVNLSPAHLEAVWAMPPEPNLL